MEPQTQTSSAGSLDPQAVALAKAIRQSESGGNFNASGQSGEYGAYQYTEPTWQKDSALAGINVPLKQATKEQQNQVAYTRIKKWKDSGYNPGQIASMWNAGEEEPNAYTGKFSDGSPSVGTNKKGVKFNVPQYAQSVAQAYQTLKGGGQVGADPNNPSSTSAPKQNQDMSIGGFLGNVASSGANFVGGIANAVMHPIKTVEGLGSMAVGGIEKGYGALTNQDIQTPQTKNFDQLLDFYKKRYGGSSIDEVAKNILHTAYTDPVGVAADASIFLGGVESIAGKIGAANDLEEAMRIANSGGKISEISAANGASTASRVASTIGKVNDYVNPITLAGKGISKASGLVGTTLSGVEGLSTGAGAEPISQGFKAASAGGDARQAFVDALRGNTSPEELVNQAKDAAAQVVSTRNTAYKQMLSKLGGDSSTYDISPIIKEVDAQLEKFGIKKNADGSLDFSRSAIGEGADATKIEQVYNDLRSWGTKPGDRTALGIDTLKRRIGNYYSPNSDIRAFITSSKNATSKVLNDAPGYTQEMKNYADLTDQIDETRKALSLGDKASVETSFKKLTSSLKNNDVKKQIIQELDQATGGNLLSSVAGQRMSSLMPRGLAVYTDAAGIGGLSALFGGGILPILGMAMTTSPRIVGVFVNALGMGSAKAAKVMALLNKFRTPVTGAGLVNRTLQEVSPKR